jgi:hypothetical protein
MRMMVVDDDQANYISMNVAKQIVSLIHQINECTEYPMLMGR